MKVSEGIIILSLMTIVLGIWYLYGSLMLLNGLLTNPEYSAIFDNLYVNGGKTYFKIIAYISPVLFLLLVVGSLLSLLGKKAGGLLVLIISCIMLFNELIPFVMGDEWMFQAILSPHITPILFIFNIIYFLKVLSNKKMLS